MRTRNFLVPQELIENFADAIEEHGFDNSYRRHNTRQ